MMRQNEARRRTPVLVMLDVRPARARPRVVRARGRSVRVDRRPRSTAPAGRVEVMLEHRRDRRHRGPAPPRAASWTSSRSSNRTAPTASSRPRPAGAAGALVAVMGRMRGDDSGALERARPRRRHARGRHDHARRLRGMGAEPSLPSDRRPVRARRIPRPLLEPNHPPMAAKRPSSFVCITRAGLTASVALGLTSVFAGGPWLFAALAAAIAPHALLAWADRRKLASLRRDRDGARRCVRCSRSSPSSRTPPTAASRRARRSAATSGELQRRAPRAAYRGRPGRRDGQRAAARPRRALDRRRDRGVVGPPLRRDARRARTEPRRSSSSIAALGEGGWVLHTIVYAFAVGAVPARVARDGDDRTPELVPRRDPAPVTGRCRVACSPRSRSCSSPRSSHRSCPGRAAHRGSTTGRSATAPAAAS